ncbi:hypothetical protein PILCRDRAFT_269079 [Piloderma croceum F 1598]|uniref:Uncharacterized protein n=1 Tax=Piloderma croceum (strain F 1598) TaxID=765440 RepID=A0A0C3CE74_PILCF|nr:hypothetical protein PILCRDRAFT_269079 [Piloderma croceum F 1598]
MDRSTCIFPLTVKPSWWVFTSIAYLRATSSQISFCLPHLVGWKYCGRPKKLNMTDRYSKYVHICLAVVFTIILPITSRIFIAMTDGPLPQFRDNMTFPVSFYWGHTHNIIPHEL